VRNGVLSAVVKKRQLSVCQFASLAMAKVLQLLKLLNQAPNSHD